MIVLGLSIGEFSSAALVADGVLLGASYEERFHRKKCLSGFPYRAIQHLLERNGIGPEKIDRVAVVNETTCGAEFALVQRLNTFGVEDYVREAHEYHKPILFDGQSPQYLDVFKDRIQDGVFPNWIRDRVIRDGETIENSRGIRTELIRDALGVRDVDISFVEHHLSHAIYGLLFAPPGSDRTLVFTADSFGDYSNANVYRAEGARITNVHSSGDHNLGRLFRNITLLLGMKPYQHEYKVMGLAPYAAPTYAAECENVFASYMDRFDGQWRYTLQPRDHYFTFQEALEGQRFDNIAGGLQSYFEARLLEWFEYYLARNRDCDSVVFSGGLSMNVKANLLLERLSQRYGMPFFAAPSADDYSHCISVAYAANGACGETFSPETLSQLDVGYAFSNSDIEHASAWASSTGWAIENRDSSRAAELLSDGKIFAHCRGRAEFGARALGFRSIVADPRNFDTVRKINVAIKKRDFWMPFAPSVVEGHQDDFFEDASPTNLRFMASAVSTTARGRCELGAATHPYDHTARPQLVSKSGNPGFHELIDAFGAITGTHGLLNTSLNLHGYPIVNDAADLIFVLENSALDGCILDDRLLLRPKTDGSV